MKNNSRGFIASILIVMIALLAIGGGLLYLSKTKVGISQNEQASTGPNAAPNIGVSTSTTQTLKIFDPTENRIYIEDGTTFLVAVTKVGAYGVPIATSTVDYRDVSSVTRISHTYSTTTISISDWLKDQLHEYDPAQFDKDNPRDGRPLVQFPMIRIMGAPGLVIITGTTDSNGVLVASEIQEYGGFF